MPPEIPSTTSRKPFLRRSRAGRARARASSPRARGEGEQGLHASGTAVAVPPTSITWGSGARRRSRASARRRASRSRLATAAAGSTSTTSRASSNAGALATTSPSWSSTSEWPSKTSSSWPPTALTNAIQHVLSRARMASISSRSPTLADVERRGRDVADDVGSGQREIGRGRARLPDVLADGRTDERLAEPQQHELAPDWKYRSSSKTP